MLRQAFEDTINQAGKEAFAEAIEIGIENTVIAFYNADVVDDEIRVIGQKVLLFSSVSAGKTL